MTQTQGPTLATTNSDLNTAYRRAEKLHKGGQLDAKAEIVQNIYPILMNLVRSVAPKEDVEQLEADVDELLANEGSVLQPELAQLIETFVVGTKELVDQVRLLKLDDVTQKRLEDICAQLDTAAPIVLNEVAAAAIDLEDEDDEDDDDDDEDETPPIKSVPESPEGA